MPGEGNNVMYWPDDYDRHVAKVESSWCTMTKIHKDTMSEAAALLLQLKEGSEAHALAMHHADMYSTFSPRAGWKKAKEIVVGGVKKVKNAARKRLNFLRCSALVYRKTTYSCRRAILRSRMRGMVGPKIAYAPGRTYTPDVWSSLARKMNKPSQQLLTTRRR